MRSTCTTAAALVFLAGSMAFAEAPYTGNLIYGDSGVTVGEIRAMTSPIVSGQPVEIQTTVTGEIQGQVAVLLYYQRMCYYSAGGHHATHDVMIGFTTLPSLSGTQTVTITGVAPFQLGYEWLPTGSAFYIVKTISPSGYSYGNHAEFSQVVPTCGRTGGAAGSTGPHPSPMSYGPADFATEHGVTATVVNLPSTVASGQMLSAEVNVSGSANGRIMVGLYYQRLTDHGPGHQATQDVLIGYQMLAGLTGTTRVSLSGASPFEIGWDEEPTGDVYYMVKISTRDQYAGLDAPPDDGNVINPIYTDASWWVAHGDPTSGTTLGGGGGGVTPPANRAPSVLLTSPANGAMFVVDNAVTFSCDATDPDGDPLTYSWASSIQGALGAEASFSRSDLVMGGHVVVLTVSDGHVTRTAQVQLTVWSGNYAPTVAISSPAAASYHAMGDVVQLSCSALDADGDPLTYQWTSSLDGQLGSAAEIDTSVLSEGTHVIFVTVADGHGNSADATVFVIIIQDDDRDGMADDWEETYGSDLEPGDDLDGDGYANLQEYLAGTDPTSSESYPGMGSGDGGVSCAATTTGAAPFAAPLVFGLALAAWAAAARRRVLL